MKALLNIDQAVVAAHQWVLDKAQLDNNKAVDLATQAICIGALIKAMIRFDNGEYLSMFWLPASVFAAFVISRSRTAFKNASFLRIILLVVAAVPVSSGILMMIVEYGIGACCVAQFYFMACDKPKPPKRKSDSVFA